MPSKKAKKEEATATTGVQDDLRVGSTGALRPVPQENVFNKLKLHPKFLLAIAAVVVLAIFLFKGQNTQSSQLSITAQQNKFKIDFTIRQYDETNISKFLEKLQISKELLGGVQFELDSTSSAKLAFAAPVVINTKAEADRLTFSGSTEIPILNSSFSSPSGFKLPSTTSVALYSKDLKPRLLKNANIPKEVTTWIAQNLKSESGQYLVIFNKNNDFYLSTKPQNAVNFSNLQKLSPYKQEVENNINIHLSNLAFFQIGEWVYATNSLQNAKDIIAIQNGQAPHVNFPKTEKEVSLAIFLRGNGEVEPGTLSMLVENGQSLEKYLKNTKEALFVLSDKKISGYIDF